MNTPNMINPNPQPMANTGFSQPQFRNIPINRRGRSMATGRYISRGYDNHYSGHSIYDKLIANMELTYDECRGEHDEKIIDTAIRMVNQNR